MTRVLDDQRKRQMKVALESTPEIVLDERAEMLEALRGLLENPPGSEARKRARVNGRAILAKEDNEDEEEEA
jgi:hypothetical protein